MGYLLLEGGAEFGGGMRGPDLEAIALAGGFDASIRIIPTAAAPDHNHDRAGRNGTEWFTRLGARNVAPVPLTDKASAANPKIVDELRRAKLIYLLGGFTHYLAQTLIASPAWDAALEAYANGAVIAGSSAGAMVLCAWYFDPGTGRVEKGLSLVPNTLVLPHHNTFGKNWAPRLLREAPGVTLIGIDERTGLLDDGRGAQWRVWGDGSVTLYRAGAVESYPAGAALSII